jgi:hypothetical protein
MRFFTYVLSPDNMPERRSSISKARSYGEIGEYWDEHDLSDFWKKTKCQSSRFSKTLHSYTMLELCDFALTGSRRARRCKPRLLDQTAGGISSEAYSPSGWTTEK